MKSDIRKWKSLPTEKLSSRVFYPLVILCVLVFALFWFVGYDRMFADNPNFNDPLFTDALLVLAYLLTIASVGLGAWSAYRTISLRGKSESLNNNIPVKKIGYSEPCTIESFDPSFEELNKNCAIWRSFAKTGEELAVKGLANLQKIADEIN